MSIDVNSNPPILKHFQLSRPPRNDRVADFPEIDGGKVEVLNFAKSVLT